MAGAVEPCAALADMVIDAQSPAVLADGGNDDGLPGHGDSSGLGDTDIVPEDDSAGGSSENVSDVVTDDDASEAGSWNSRAGSDSESDDESQSSEVSSDEVPDDPQPVPNAPAAGLNSEEAILTEQAMWQRALRMLTGGTGAPVSSGMGCAAEPATWEALLLLDSTANNFIDAAERGELQPTAGPLDRVDTRGFLAADLYGLTQLSAEDAQRLGKRVQERAGAARKEVAAKEKATYLKVHKARAAADSNADVAAGLGQTVAQIEQAAAAEVTSIKAKTYATLLKGIGQRAPPPEPALPPQPSAAQLRQGMQEMERAKAVWLASVDAHDDAWPAVEAALAKMEKFDERTSKKKILSDKDFNRSYELEGKMMCALAVSEAAEKRAVAARATLQAAIALLQRLLDILDERDRAGKVSADDPAYADLWEDAQISLSRARDFVHQHDKEQLCELQQASGRTGGAGKRSKQR